MRDHRRARENRGAGRPARTGRDVIRRRGGHGGKPPVARRLPPVRTPRNPIHALEELARAHGVKWKTGGLLSPLASPLAADSFPIGAVHLARIAILTILTRGGVACVWA